MLHQLNGFLFFSGKQEKAIKESKKGNSHL